MNKIQVKQHRRKKRKLRVRKKIFGTSERPRMSVFKSNKNFYVQVIDDSKGHTRTSFSTLTKKNAKLNVETVAQYGEEFGKELIKLKITSLVFDRNGYLYHGIIKAFADGARKSGVQF